MRSLVRLMWLANLVIQVPADALEPFISDSFDTSFVNPAPYRLDVFGYALASIEDEVFVGAMLYDRSPAQGAGIVYRFDRNTGALLGTISSPGSRPLGEFGYSIVETGTDILVAAPGEETVYLIDPESGEEKQRFTNSASRYGWGLAATKDVALVGAPSPGNGGGQAFLYDLSTGELVHRFANPSSTDGDAFGAAVAIDDQYIAISAWGGDLETVENTGVVHVFDRTSAELLYSIRDPTPSAYDNFGDGLAINNGRLLVGSSGDDIGGLDVGAAHMFDIANGSLLQTFANPRPERFSYFGNAVDLDGDLVLVGAHGADFGGSSTGAAYLFRASSGELLRSWTSPSASPSGAHLGEVVSISNGWGIVGAPQDDVNASNSGAAYAFLIVPEPSTLLMASLLLAQVLALKHRAINHRLIGVWA